MKYLKVSMFVTAIVTACITVMTCLSVFGVIDFVNDNRIGIVLSVLFGAFCAVQVLCVLTTKPSFKKIGFYLLHIGLILFLFGSFMYFISGEKIYVSGVEVGNIAYGHIKSTDGSDVDLGFDIQIKQFDVERYPADENGNQADKFLNAQTVIYPTDKESFDKSLYVNGPISYGGWKIYLMDYDRATYNATGNTTLTLLFKKNPGEELTIASVVLIIIGSFLLAFQNKQVAPIKQKGGRKKDAK